MPDYTLHYLLSFFVHFFCFLCLHLLCHLLPFFFKRVCLDIPYSIFSFSTMLIILAGCTRRSFVKPNILLLFVKFFPLKNQEFFFRTNIPIFSFIVSEISFVKFMYLNFLSFCFLRVLLVRDVTI